jgi:antitoxin component YwqK of YwqJK toxin-antitoxin module
MRHCRALVIAFCFCMPAISSAEVIRFLYPSGALRSEYTLKEGKLEGISKKYYEQADGIAKVYSPNGTLLGHGMYANGIREGTTVLYSEYGKPQYIDIYKGGTRVSRKSATTVR